jgi:hypothetical protein
LPFVRKCYCHPVLSWIEDENGNRIQAVAAGHPTRDAREFEQNVWSEWVEDAEGGSDESGRQRDSD